MPRYRTAPHRDTDRTIAQSAAGMIRIHGDNAWAEANRVTVRFAKLNDAKGEKTWRAIVRAIEKQRLLTRPAINLLSA
jgi:hypothetical protein